MAPVVASSIQFIEAALSNGGGSPFGLAYSDPNQRWLIRKDLLSLLQEFPSFSLSIDTFFHNDGTSTKLLVARGSLPISGFSAPAVPVTIWLHENYPTVGPIVFVLADPGCNIHPDHPFVDSSSGLTSTPYLSTWSYPRCSLSDLARNLAKLFSKDHPFWNSQPSSGSAAHPTRASKTEALDRLSGIIHYDITVLRSTVDEEVQDLLGLQEELCARCAATSRIVRELKSERADLKGKVRELEREAGRIYEWQDSLNLEPAFTGSARRDTEDVIDSVFEVDGEKSRLILDCLASERAIEDTIYALDKAIEIGAVRFETYIKQVRVLAREQFQCIDMRMKHHEEITSHGHAPLS
ncbi:hypothetical protein CDL15_Pgr023742 [Punica granatum]|nr:hypothetical protein CDL15_Pgr023742 [Punica granatum]PKI63632.1 hypothetical protein CRG98_016015 [Punica granatum]